MPRGSEWFEQTPDETLYQIVMYGPLGDALQEVTMEREEFVALKAHLAQIRDQAADGDVELTEKQKDRAHVIDFIRDKVKDRDIDLILIFAEALHRHIGCGTPAEEFVRAIVRCLPDGLTPEMVRADLKEFDQNFHSIQQDAVYLSRFYPTLAAEAAEAGRIAR